MVSKKILDTHQQELLTIVKNTRINLALARAVRVEEIRRRANIAALELRQDFERRMEGIEFSAKTYVDGEIEVHASALDEALIAAFNAGVPIRQMAMEGFGSRYDGTVNALIKKLREDGRIGSKVIVADGTAKALIGTTTELKFPKPLDIDSVLSDRMTVHEPKFTALGRLMLVEPDENDPEDAGIWVEESVQLELDARDSWFASIALNARAGTPNMKATTCTLYRHPFTGELTVLESAETGEVVWDHPVARWVKEHRDESEAGYAAAIDAVATAE